MTSHITLVLVIAFGINAVHGCSLEGSRNFVDDFIRSCPSLIGDQSKKYCCLNLSDQSFYCCDAQEWALETGLGIVTPAIIGVLAVISIFILCISCLCCSCCPWYRRRHRGVIYGAVQTTGVVHQVPGINPPQTHSVNIYPPNTVNQPVSAVPFQSQPPPYTAEPYAKQAPYNPNYQ